MKKKIFIYIPNRKVFKEYKELFPLEELGKHFEINYVYGEIIFDKTTNFKQILFPQFIRTAHALLHFSLMWYRKFTTLSYRFRAFQYFGTKSDIKETSNFLKYNGKRHSILIRFLIYIVGNYVGVKVVHKIVTLLFWIWKTKTKKIFNTDIHCLILPYGGGISLEFDFLVWLCRQSKIKTIAIQENWDNLSSKSILLEHPTHFFTWGPQSSSHLRSFQLFKGVTKEIGSLRINCFYEFRESYLAKLSSNLKTGPRDMTVLIIGTGPGNHDLRLINSVLECFRINSIKEFELVYRPHPFTQLSTFELEEISQINKIRIDLPNKSEVNSHRLNLILNSTAVISLYSTVLLEASIINKPCIIPGFIIDNAGYKTSNYLDDSPHYSGLSILGNIFNADTESELIDILFSIKDKNLELVYNKKFFDWYCKNLNTSQEIIDEVVKLK
jgi:hypothetical protein